MLRRLTNRIIPGVERTARSQAQSTGPTSRLVNFADLIKVVVVGNPTEQQLGELETHFRAINSTPEGTHALWRLRHLTEDHGRYPVMIFNQETGGRPVTLERRRTARPDERVDLAAPVGVNGTAQRGESLPMTQLIRSVAIYLMQSQQGRLNAPRPNSLEAVHARAMRMIDAHIDTRIATPLPLGPHNRTRQTTHTLGSQPSRVRTLGPATSVRPNASGEAIRRSEPVSTHPAVRQAQTSETHGSRFAPRASVEEQLSEFIRNMRAEPFVVPDPRSLAASLLHRRYLEERQTPSPNARPSQANGNAAAQPLNPPPTWSQALEPWLGPDCQAVIGQWEAIESEAHGEADINGIAAFKQFLRRLSDSRVCRNPAQHAEVVKWLAEAALPERVILRAEAFEACIEGTQTCDDNILLTWNKLGMLKIKVDAQDGRYEGRLADLQKTALSIFRMQEIEKVADAKVQELYAARKRGDPSMFFNGEAKIIDPLETHLAYQIGLREALNLPIDVSDMNFPTLSYVTSDDIEKARASIAQAEKERFPVWLLASFDPFVAEIRRQLGSEKSAEIVEASVETTVATFDERLAAKLRAENMPDGDDERREMGVVLLREIQYETWLPHANSVLIAAGLDPLPSNDLEATQRAGDLVDSTLMA